ncbi:hypothetical protein [Paraburkholderia hayleyella]|uniref:hypothetical protein n=1 Tax=Paraburkholderia hayleyella TaxID=2152889 RepID=UPI001FEC3459|nr:hypothetical protein [Paraburkholderia hayleyella]
MFPSFLRRRLAALATPVFATLAAITVLGGCATHIIPPVPPAAKAVLIDEGKDGLLIPLHVERADQGHARLGVPVQLDGKAVYLALDTGTQGVRVLSKALPQGYSSKGPTITLNLANGAKVSGPTATLPFSLFGTQPVNITAQTVTDVDCQPNFRRCFAMDGYTGEFGFAFSGLLGIGLQQDDDACCNAPFAALPADIGKRYLVHPSFTKPYLVLSPSAKLTSRFTMVPLPMSAQGVAQWPEGCAQVSSKMRFCAPVVFATGGTEMIRIETDKAPSWLGENDVGNVLGQGNYDTAVGVGTWVHRFNGAQVTIVKAAPGRNRIVVGLSALQNIDLLFDLQRNQMGVYSAKSVEEFGL